jgi:hypothetical protein
MYAVPMDLDYDIDDTDIDPGFDAYDAGFLDGDFGYEDYEPSPYDGTYSED